MPSIMTDGPKILTENGHRILSRGGADGVSDDDLLVLEILKRAPGMSQADLQTCFVEIRMEYGEDAVKAIKSGHVKFAKSKPQ